MIDLGPNKIHDPTQSGNLLGALQRYQIDGNTAELQTAFTSYQAWKTRMQPMTIRQPSWTQVIGNAISSFTLFPHSSYDFFVVKRVKQSNAEAIASHWQAAGEHLSYALISHILKQEGETNGE